MFRMVCSDFLGGETNVSFGCRTARAEVADISTLNSGGLPFPRAADAH